MATTPEVSLEHFKNFDYAHIYIYKNVQALRQRLTEQCYLI